MKCKITDCLKETVGKSKYCAAHRSEAHARWKEMIGEKAEERKAQQDCFRILYEEAHSAGMSAGGSHVPQPMVVEQHENPIDDNSPVEKRWYVPEGLCGFAWINVRPGTCAFARWAVREKLARKAYGGGIEFWVSEFNQSVEKKEKYARAFAEVLRKHGVTAYPGSRLD